MDGARITLDTLQMAQSIKNDSYRSKALARIAESQAEAGEFDAALHMVQSITEDYYRSEALAKIAEQQAQAGQFDAAIDTSKFILVERGVHLYYIIKAMIQAGDREVFKRILVSSAQDLLTTYKVVGLLFEVYKDQSKSLSETILRLV
jgi:hypothetical protein